jgi:ribosomal protein S18 acetylase RimI-like enzyme
VIHISALRQVPDDLAGAFRRLLPQLSTSAPQPSDAEIEELVTSPATTLLVARDDEIATEGEGERAGAPGRSVDAGSAQGQIVGMLTLVVFRIPTGVRAWIEDVVVDSASGRRGVGEALTRAALDLAEAGGALTVELTSRPSREAANRLYQKVGFVARETNVYRYRSSSPPF